MTNIAERYNKFQNDFGQDVVQDYESIIEGLFSPEFTKIGNRKKFVVKRDNFMAQLEDIKMLVGGWVIDPTKTIKSVDRHDYVISYRQIFSKVTWDIIAILESSDGVRIDSVDEIFYIVES